MMAHGAQKVFGAFGGPGLKTFTETTRKLNLEPAEILGPVGAYSEFLGGLSILLGFLTPVGAFALINTMAVAIWKVHGKNGFWSSKRGYEFNGLIIAAAASLLLTGPGKVSVDGLIFGSKKEK
jgi:putative oxidoreductase